MSDITSQIFSSNNTYDYILKYSPNIYEDLAKTSNLHITNIDNSWMILYYPQNNPFNISNSGYSQIPKLYTITDSTALIKSGITILQNQENLDLRGQNTLIGIIDTGIDYQNSIFNFSKNNSKIEAIWDQTINNNSKNIPNPYNFGCIYSKDEINEALASNSPYETVPTTDTIGHGTALAGIAAGSYDKENDFSGVALDASIICVKLRMAKQYLKDYYLIPDNSIAFQEDDIMLGIHFIKELAITLKKPVVILLGLGTTLGPHNNDTPLVRYIDMISKNPSTAIITATGNEGNKKNHFSGLKNEYLDYTPVEINVSAGNKGFTLELWASRAELFSISFISPTGEIIPRISATKTDSSHIISFVFEKTIINVDYIIVENLSGNELIFMRFINPTEGIWKINVHGVYDLSGTFDMWLPMSNFMYSEVYFLNPNSQKTLTSPSTSSSAISVGAYNATNDSLYFESGRGPSSDNHIKPDLLAPGVGVYAPFPNNTYGTITGTSVAAAITAGAAALIFSWNLRNSYPVYLSTTDIKTILVRGAKRNPALSYPNNELGYGMLDLYNSFIKMSLK